MTTQSADRPIDLAFGQREEGREAFESWVAEACAARQLTFEVVHDGVVEQLCEDVQAGRARLGMLVDFTARWGIDGDPYVRLCYAVRDAGGRVVGDPDAAVLAENKAVMHHRLLDAGVPVPPSLVLRKWDEDRPLSEAERARLGERIVIKPSKGWGWKGVVLDGAPEKEDIARARDFDRSDDYLVQRQIGYARLLSSAGEALPAWWRVFYHFGEIIPCWWSPESSTYRMLEMSELCEHGLLPLARIAERIAAATGMDFFSTEICLADEEAGDGMEFRAGGHPFFVIDYVNDQCDMRAQSEHPTGPPDAVVRHLAERFAELAWRHKEGVPLNGTRTLWLRENELPLPTPPGSV
jgi:hypothetical protein